MAADAPLAVELCAPDQREALDAYRDEIRALSDIDRQSTDRPKTGVDLGVTALNPVTGEQVPVYAADYVLADYGTGAIMAVPAHDQRDLDFARAFDLPVRVVVDTGGADPAETGVATTGDGVLVNSGPYDGLAKDEAIARIVADLEQRGGGKGAINYRLRDWLLSRQRFWGAPIPIVHCADGDAAARWPSPTTSCRCGCPTCGARRSSPPAPRRSARPRTGCRSRARRAAADARRDTDTMDTFVDSSWYFLRYCSPDYEDGPFDPDAVRAWMPVAQYVGGVEHAILHLLYARFFTKVLHDMGMLDVVEPFAALMNQGQVVNQGKAMSKSLGNGVELGRSWTRTASTRCA